MKDFTRQPALLNIDGALRCPKGKTCRPQVVEELELFTGFVSKNPARLGCSSALSYGGAFFCKTLWKFAPVQVGESVSLMKTAIPMRG